MQCYPLLLGQYGPQAFIPTINLIFITALLVHKVEIYMFFIVRHINASYDIRQPQMAIASALPLIMQGSSCGCCLCIASHNVRDITLPATVPKQAATAHIWTRYTSGYNMVPAVCVIHIASLYASAITCTQLMSSHL